MPDVQKEPFNVICGVLGTYLFCYSFVSYLLKDRLYISEACTTSPGFTLYAFFPLNAVDLWITSKS
jgi:hypothetical protein